MKKRCKVCRKSKPLSEFGHQVGWGVKNTCKKCNCIQAKEYYNAHREERLAYARRFRKANEERIRAVNRERAKTPKRRASRRAWTKRNPEKIRAINLRRYGVTIDRYNLMLKAQAGGCAICGGKNPGKNRKFFSVDHSHSTGAVRGLLCIKCNAALGYFNDSVDLLRRARAYLLAAGLKEVV